MVPVLKALRGLFFGWCAVLFRAAAVRGDKKAVRPRVPPLPAPYLLQQSAAGLRAPPRGRCASPARGAKAPGRPGTI